jgi:uncharacterized NAD(P)/FAD-binding protein YdhS
VSLTEEGGQVTAVVRPRGEPRTETLRVATVINCTGPEGDVRSLEDPLLQALIADGVARPDSLGLGLDVGDDLALVDRAGQRSPTVSLVGPLLRGRWWEATAVPELRVHAARLAARLHEELAASPAPA